MRTNKTLKVFIFLLVLGLIAATGVGVTLYKRISEPYQGYPAGEQFVEIAPGSSTLTIGESLVAGGVIRNSATFRAALWRTGEARALKAGTYRFDAPMSAVEVVRKIAQGDTWVRRLTFPEGLNMFEMAKIFEAHGLGTAASFVS